MPTLQVQQPDGSWMPLSIMVTDCSMGTFIAKDYGVSEEDVRALADIVTGSVVQVDGRNARVVTIHRSYTEPNGHHVSMSVQVGQFPNPSG